MTTGKKREIMREVSCFLRSYDEIDLTFALGIMLECGILTITDLYAIMKLTMMVMSPLQRRQKPRFLKKLVRFIGF